MNNSVFLVADGLCPEKTHKNMEMEKFQFWAAIKDRLSRLSHDTNGRREHFEKRITDNKYILDTITSESETKHIWYKHFFIVLNKY